MGCWADWADGSPGACDVKKKGEMPVGLYVLEELEKRSGSKSNVAARLGLTCIDWFGQNRSRSKLELV
jgi:hypothetical protein